MIFDMNVKFQTGLPQGSYFNLISGEWTRDCKMIYVYENGFAKIAILYFV